MAASALPAGLGLCGRGFYKLSLSGEGRSLPSSSPTFHPIPRRLSLSRPEPTPTPIPLGLSVSEPEPRPATNPLGLSPPEPEPRPTTNPLRLSLSKPEPKPTPQAKADNDNPARMERDR
jgi:hypothetical protein